MTAAVYRINALRSSQLFLGGDDTPSTRHMRKHWERVFPTRFPINTADDFQDGRVHPAGDFYAGAFSGIAYRYTFQASWRPSLGAFWN